MVFQKNKQKNNNKPIAVIKVGGDMVLHQADKEGLANNVKDLLKDGWNCVLLHGGGPQVNALQTLHGLVPNKIDGRRITSKDDLTVVKQALCGEVNVELVSALLAANVPAFGCHGASGRLIESQKRPPVDCGNQGMVDFGEVGDVKRINTDLIHTLLLANQVPVIASLGVSGTGQIFNINADTTVAAIARALQAHLLILSTKVGGIFKDIKNPNSRIPKITPTSARKLIRDGIITDGMIPKVQEAIELLQHEVHTISITNASRAGSFLDIASGSDKTGTFIKLD